MPISFPVRINTRVVSNGSNQTVYYPKVVEMQNRELQRSINHSLVHETEGLIKEQVGNMPSTVAEMLGSYEVKTNERNVLSVSLSNYTYHEHAAHGMTYIKSLTFDLEKGKRCSLKDLFNPGSDYVGRISELVALQIKERDVPLLGEFTGIRPDQDFYLADKALVIYFQLYEITPYVVGFPMFPISVYSLQDLIEESGPLGRMAVNQ
ncbi:DUF3298 and DUF4163 domain-containing protein [Rossellomorea aquimaris]|uniref:DUF3298 and DUF4163 domain-containing protein n=1 Tax=Rossellomorea aquimaris TaxID=189382 RepID=UPI001CD64476|nr:DUF3298 and DUF4163 domain-containing protein [Rossellomorea aquimaris]MCA1054974.1 DUF3298 and DUF4163 domain-containing protein [Rossellomorea aquimaris]